MYNNRHISQTLYLFVVYLCEYFLIPQFCYLAKNFIMPKTVKLRADKNNL